MIPKLKAGLIAATFLGCFCFFLLEMLTFYLGFFNHGSILIVLNQYGEMTSEAFVWFPISLILILYGLILALKQYREIK
jgi:hypothetical protein